MASRKWEQEVAKKRIQQRLKEVRDVRIYEYVRDDTDLNDLGNGIVYRVDGVHMSVDILNMAELLGVTASEGVISHKRTLRFLDLHYRAVRHVLKDVDAIQVDFHNQRLHAVFAKPYGDEAGRVHRAVATAQLIIDTLKETGEDGDDPLPAAKVRVGIDSGEALAVNNGRRGHREPLFLGEPANRAAKRSGGGADSGIYLTNTARDVIGLDKVDDEDATRLTKAQIEESEEDADLPVTVDDVLDQWEKDLASAPIGSFEFYAHTPPFANLDLEVLTPANSRRQDAISIYADIDGFTNYISDRISDDGEAKNAVRVLHVLRGELDAVLHNDFEGRKIRFIGDCIHGIMVEGTASNTDAELSTEVAIKCAGALRSSFETALDELAEAGIDATELGLAIGLEYGPTSVTRLGVHGERIRCCVSRSVLASETEQLRCDGSETGIGVIAEKKAPAALAELFSHERKRANLTYDTVTSALAKARARSASTLRPAAAAPTVAAFAFPAKAAGQSAQPTKFA